MTPSPSPCRIVRIRLFQFRNYREEVVDLAPGITLVSGANAQGKTNLLEAIATCALTRSPRAPAADVLAWGCSSALVEVVAERRPAPVVVAARFRRSADGSVSRSLTVDGHPRPAQAVLGLLPVVLFWPDDLLLVKGGPEGRRRLVDVLLSQTDPRIAAELVRFRRLLDQRNALLRQIRSGLASRSTLSPFTRALATSGGLVRFARARLVAALHPLAHAAHRDLSSGEDLSLRYLVDGSASPEASPLAAATPADAAADLAAALDTRFEEEVARGTTVCGPHRDDLEILLDGRPARTTASQGQQRTIVLACKLAEVLHLATTSGTAPILLLDDVLSELDADRRRRLLEAVASGTASQAVVTTTDDASFDLPPSLPLARLHVASGHVSRACTSSASPPSPS